MTPSPARAEDLKELADMKIPAADPGTDTAKPMAPSWCATVGGAREGQGNTPGSLRRTIESAEKDYTIFASATRQLCTWPNAPEIAHATAVVIQMWMNRTGQKQPQAVESLALRANVEKLEADKKALCGALTVSDEEEGEEKAFMAARRKLFGCPTSAPLWLENSALEVGLLGFLDASSAEPDELVRTAVVLSNSHYVLSPKNDYFDKELVQYSYDQLDFKAVSEAGMQKILAQAPYAKNTYARAVGLESAAMARYSVGLIQQEVDKRTAKDAEWKTLIVTAPQKAVADWTALATKYKDQLARSTAYEKVFWGPSAKASKGCFASLRKDFLDVLKDMKHANENELHDSLNNPIAAVLFSRLVACAARDTDPAYAKSLNTVASTTRWARGPRLAAYYGAVEALGPILADRTKFSVKPEDLHVFTKNALVDTAHGVAEEAKSTYDSMGWVGDGGEGTVKTVTKGAKGVAITFVTTKAQVMSESCTETNRIVMFANDGRPIYYRNCHDTGLVTINTTPESITLPVAEWADGIKPGVILKFEATRGHAAERLGLPVTVYADKSKKKLLNWMGFGL